MKDSPPPSPQPSLDHPLLRRRNSLSSTTVTVPTKLTVIPNHSSSSSTTSTATSSASSSSSFPSDDMELLSIRPTSSCHNYTSLKDILPLVAVNSPKPNSAATQSPLGSDICIRNRLVKQAAWAYLQPMSTSTGSDDGGLLHQLWPRVVALFDYVRLKVARTLDWMLRVVRIRSAR